MSNVCYIQRIRIKLLKIYITISLFLKTKKHLLSKVIAAKKYFWILVDEII